MAAAATADFGLRLLRKLSKGSQGSDVVLSPASLSLALGMAFAGADGKTKRQMAAALFPGLKDEDVHEGLGDLVRLIAAKNDQYDLATAISLVAQQDFDFKRDFLELCEGTYQSALRSVDFKKPEGRDAAKDEVNVWVEEITKGKIKDLIQDGAFTKDTRLALVNAIYFKGKWTEKFEPEATRKETFYARPGKELQVDTMHKRSRYGYTENKKVQALRLDYRGAADVSMLVVLPKRRFGLAAWLAKATGESFQKLVGKLSFEEVVVSLPKWRAEKTYDLAKALAALGVKEAFQRFGANFRRVADPADPKDALYISTVLHNAFIEVEEEGTVAAAATAFFGASACTFGYSEPEPPKVFKADHPFLFAVLKGPHVLFLGSHTQ